MQVTVAICTRNRAVSLARALGSLVKMVVPDGTSWEVIVVNNAASDNTDEVIQRYASVLPIRREYEPKAGLSNARNRAVSVARGRYIAWTDDDVVVDRNWLSAYLSAFDKWPNAIIFGGKILPVLEQPVPRWLEDSIDIVAGIFAKRDFGDDPIPLTTAGRVIPFGANYAIRTEEQKEHLYDPRLGPGSSEGLTGEETSVICAFLSEGKQGYWVPESVVSHHIPLQRQTLRYVRKFYRAYGRTLADENRDQAAPRLFGVPLWVWRRTATDSSGYISARITSQPRNWMERLTALYVDLGMIEYSRRSYTHQSPVAGMSRGSRSEP
jgi:glucosyl-dolichyl phosphate glucuronosyltransferase